MHSGSSAHRIPSPLRSPPVILFRTECHDSDSVAYNSTFVPEGISSRNPREALTEQAFDDCLSWRRVNTPLIPFTNNWTRAMRKREQLIKAARKKIVIVAIWAKDLRNVYSAYEAARLLKYRDDGQDRRRQLRNHNDEYLVYGGILADEYRLLAVFEGQRERRVELGVPGLVRCSTLPDAFLSDMPGMTPEEKLERMIYMYTGIQGQSAQLWYLILYLIKAFDCRPRMSFTVHDVRRS